MTLANLTDTPTWALFRLDLRRHWRAGNVYRAVGIVAAILAVQALFTYWSFHGLPPGPGWLQMLMWYFGLRSDLWEVFLGSGSPRLWLPFWDLYLVIVGLTAPASTFLLPAWAGNSIALDRERRRLTDLIASGMQPIQILLAKGLAALFPFVILEFVRYATYLLVFAAMTVSHLSGSTSAGRTLSRLFFVSVLLQPVTLAASMGLLVCISALCSRAHHAVALCYFVRLVLLPAAFALPISGLLLPHRLYFLEIIAFAILLPLALRALRHVE